MTLSLSWSPLLPTVIAIALAAAGAIVLIVAWRRKAPDMAWRGGLFFLLAFFLMGPVALHETRQGLPDKLIVVVDDSGSQKIGGRDKVTQQALDRLTQELSQAKNIEPVVIHAASEVSPNKGESTRLLTALKNALSGLPLSQVAGTVLITDGQAHDASPTLGGLDKIGPVNVILSGRKDEFDRKVTIVSAPKYGLLSENVTISVKIEEFGRSSPAPVLLRVFKDGKSVDETRVMSRKAQEFSFTLDHPGQNVFSFSTPAEDGELTPANNTAAVIVNGVRDRLRVLLVSGAPHMGERAWRNILKSDPSIDLVHFTILRSLDSIDSTPPHELSLIVFPVDELFERKLDNFDLIIFDRYKQVNLLTQRYFANIAAFVKNGGAFLMAMGPDTDIFKTALGDILPVEPVGDALLVQPYTPQLTQIGKKHPVTGDMQRLWQQDKTWGKWFTQTKSEALRGHVLMTGANDLPLLIIDKVGDGRIAALMSDNIWLWSKGEGTAGPYVDLLRNVAHWLMKEPELEDDYIRAQAAGDTITVAMRDLGDDSKSVVMKNPSGAEETLTLSTKADGWVSTTVTDAESGVYSFTSGDRKTFVVVGTAASEELSDVHTTEEKLKSTVEKTGGRFLWAQEKPLFSLHDLNLKPKNAYAVTSFESRDLIPPALALLLIIAAAFFVWWRESGRK